MNYKGFTITARSILKVSIEGAYYIVTGEIEAYEVLDPRTGYTFGLFSTIKRTQMVIDKKGVRWSRP